MMCDHRTRLTLPMYPTPKYENGCLGYYLFDLPQCYNPFSYFTVGTFIILGREDSFAGENV